MSFIALNTYERSNMKLWSRYNTFCITVGIVFVCACDSQGIFTPFYSLVNESGYTRQYLPYTFPQAYLGCAFLPIFSRGMMYRFSVKPLLANKTAYISALILIAISVLQIATSYIVPQPISTEEWYQLISHNLFSGLLSLGLLTAIRLIVFMGLFLSLYFINTRLFTKIAAVVLMASILVIAYMVSEIGFSIIYTKDFVVNKRDLVLAVNSVSVSRIGGVYFSLPAFFEGAGILLMNIAMMKNKVVNKWLCIIGIVAGILMMLPLMEGILGMVVGYSTFLTEIWYIWATITFLRSYRKLQADTH